MKGKLQFLQGELEACGFIRSKIQAVRVSSFFCSNLWGRRVGNHPDEELAKFGYRSERKLEKLMNCALFWQHARTYCLNIVNSIFFPKKAFVSTTLAFFYLLPKWESWPQTETLVVASSYIDQQFLLWQKFAILLKKRFLIMVKETFWKISKIKLPHFEEFFKKISFFWNRYI
jgi:hypothetical protein